MVAREAICEAKVMELVKVVVRKVSTRVDQMEFEGMRTGRVVESWESWTTVVGTMRMRRVVAMAARDR